LKRFFKPHFKVEGYILALIYILGREKFNITLKNIELLFHISSLTISNRKNEINNYPIREIIKNEIESL
jgi:hypothetical protein